MPEYYFCDLLRLSSYGGVKLKKIFTCLAISLLLIGTSFAAEYKPAERVNTIGTNLLTKNGIVAKDIKFEVTSKAIDNSSFATDKTISISSDDLAYAGNDNETAAVIANELGHIIAGHGSRNKLVSSITGTTTNTRNMAGALVESYKNTKEEKEADVLAVNLMANAGYNPLAAIVVLTKQTSTYWDAIAGKPANAERALNIYDYSQYAYPNSVKSGYNCNEYKNFLTYANSVIEERKENSKTQKKLDKELKKYRKDSVSQITKFKTRGGISGWDAVYGILNSQQ